MRYYAIHRFNTLLVVLAALLLDPAVRVVADPLDLDRYRGEHPVIVIYALKADEPRAFSFNLALSSEWDRIESRRIRTIDVGPNQYDLESIGRQLGVAGEEFAVVLVGLDGEIIHRTTDPDALSRILMILDQELNGDHDSRSG
ncbi:MAG: hypothetical protein ACOC2V_06930 [Alkalispirochaeta sp.]